MREIIKRIIRIAYILFILLLVHRFFFGIWVKTANQNDSFDLLTLLLPIPILLLIFIPVIVKIKNNMLKKVIFCILILVLFLVLGVSFFILKDKFEKQRKEPYRSFISKIKEGAINEEFYFEAYKDLYPLIIENDSEAMYWISWAYLGDAGIKADIIKSNIWRKRSECACFDTGKNEFTEAMSLLRNGKVKTGSVFLLKAAENGNKEAIELLKDDQYIQKNKININFKLLKYWKKFEYDNLYPYQKRIMKEFE